uniref:SUN domain-containing protein n=1 Tax=Strongyloides papillosus TaxID=174720 RepID=A0A0N5BG81_STREA
MHGFRTANSPPLTAEEMREILDTRTPLRTDYNLAKSVVYDKNGQFGYQISNLARQRLGQETIVEGTWKSYFHTRYFPLPRKVKKYFGILFQFFFQLLSVTYYFFERHIYQILLFFFDMNDPLSASYSDDNYHNCEIKSSVLRTRPVKVQNIFSRVTRVNRTPSKTTVVWRFFRDSISKFFSSIIGCTYNVISVISSKGKAVTSSFLNNNMEKEGTETSRTTVRRTSGAGKKFGFCYFCLIPLFIVLLAALLFFLLNGHDNENIAKKIDLSNKVIGDFVSQAIKSADSIKSRGVNFAGDVYHKGIDYTSDVYSKLSEDSGVIVEKSNAYFYGAFYGFVRFLSTLREFIDSMLAYVFQLIHDILSYIFYSLYLLYSTLISVVAGMVTRSRESTVTIEPKVVEKPIISITKKDGNVAVPFDEEAFTKRLLARIQVEIENAVANINFKEKEVKVIEKHIEKESPVSVENIMNEINIALAKELSNIKTMLDQKLKTVQDKMEEQQRASMSAFKHSVDGVTKEVRYKADNNYVDRILSDSFAAFKMEIQNILKEKLEEFSTTNRYTKDLSTSFSNDKYMSDVNVLIMNLLEKYDHDKTGLADYALESSGGSILGTRCTQTYNERSRVESLWGIPLWYVSYSPRTVIQRKSQGTIPGECWCFKGEKGYLTISLSRPIHVTNISYEHVSVDLIPTKEVNSAPKDIQFWSFNDVNDHDTKVNLGRFVYDTSKKPLQFFNIPLTYSNLVTPIVEMEVLSNYGAEFTCLYRLRVHGNLPTDSDHSPDNDVR